MIRFVGIFLCILVGVASFGQGNITDDVFDLGDIYSSSTRYVDLKFGNPTSKTIYILKVEHSPEVSYLLSSDMMKPDSSIQFRMQVNPVKSGVFNLVVKVYLSDQSNPVIYHLKGNLKEKIDYGNYLTRCPDFGAGPPSTNTSKELTIITIDKVTGEPLSQSTVSIIRNGEPAGSWITGRSGKFKANIPSGFFYFFATHSGYENKEAGVYVGPEISEITIPLVPVKTEEPEEQPIASEPEPVQLPPEQAETALEEQLATKTPDSTFTQSYPELATIPEDNFSETYFSDVNVVFVLDISASMKMGEKMDLMKFSLNQLVEQLRSTDRMGIVTYSSSAKVLLQPTSGNDKSTLKNTISGLEAGGMTAGGLGIKMAYKEVMKHYDPNKANMVIIITDGAFNKDSDDYEKTVKKYAKKGIVFSVVGIQSKTNDQKLMQEAATVGNGRFVLIQKLADAYMNLKREIRIASYKGTK